MDRDNEIELVQTIQAKDRRIKELEAINENIARELLSRTEKLSEVLEKLKSETSRYSLEVFCNIVNDIIEQAITHGGDTGGAYYINQEELESSINYFIEWLGIEDRVILYKDDRPKLLLKDKLELSEEE